MNKKLKVLVVDDSLVYRNILSRAVEKSSIAVVDCTASNGAIALERLEQRSIDVVLLDVFMPQMDGIETLKKIKEKHSHIPVIMISSGGEDGAKTTVTALREGAMDFILKPTFGDTQSNMEHISRQLNLLFSQILLDKYLVPGQAVRPSTEVAAHVTKVDYKDDVKEDWGHQDAMIQVKDITKDPAIDIPENQKPERIKKHLDISYSYKLPLLKGVDVIVMAASTGGPNAVEEVCKALGEEFSKPILLVQHMPPDFTRIFAEFLAKKVSIQVKEAQEGDKILGGRLLIAPGGYHMIVNPDFTVSITDDEPVNGVKPAADVLFRSVARAYAGKRVLAVTLTGMGNDGTEGIRALKRACQCYSITQSERTSVIYGMPRSVDEAGLSDESVDLKDMGTRIKEISRGR